MPGNVSSVVKCEPPSDEDDSCPQLADIFLNNKLPSEYHSVKVEQVLQNNEISSTLLQHLQAASGMEELSPLAPAGPAATPVCVKQEPVDSPALTLETLESAPNATGCSLLERHMAMINSTEELDSSKFTPLLAIKDEPTSEGEFQNVSSDETSDSCRDRDGEPCTRGSPKSWTQRDMDNALDALRNHHMSLTKASSTYGIPSTTLWQRAHRLGIDTPKKEGSAKSWSESDLRGALHALRAGAISANKASKAYGIPSSTLYKIARREGIRLAAPFNAAPVSWRRGDLPLALAAIRAGAASVQRAALLYGIPVGTLYGRCKREGIELSRSNPTPWSEDAMGEALEAVRVGQMSINQAAIHYNLPYSSLYGRFKRCKYLSQAQQFPQQDTQNGSELSASHHHDPYYHQNIPHMHPEIDPTVQNYPQNDNVPHTSTHNNIMLQDQYGSQAMYYNQSFNGIATS